jgi:hypothetical protein
MRFPFSLQVTSTAFLALGSTAVILLAQTPPPPKTNAASSPAAVASEPDGARSVAAFRRMAAVLHSPRCMNCHPATDFPKEGNEGKRHAMSVQRGPDNRGVTGMECRTCHQAVNVDGAPGAPGWELAPRSMAWEGLSDHQLADALKDPAKNGPRSLEQLYDHMANNELVGWAWHPGGKREVPPMTREEFARAVREWIDTGAVSPPAD